MFWSLILEPGKKYSSTINEGFHLSMAALDVRTVKTPNEIYPVLLKINGKDTVLCNLSKPQFLQVNLDHMFERGSKVTFFTTGTATIHLTGYLVQDDFDSSGFSDDDSSEVSDASTEDVSDSFGKKGKGDSKAESSLKKNKRKLIEAIGEEIAKKKSKPKGNEADEKGVDMSMNTLNHKSLDTSGDEDDDDDDIDLSSDDLDSDNFMGGGSDSDDSDDEDEDDDGDNDDDDDSDDSDEDDSDDNIKNKAKLQKVQKTPQQTPKKKPEEKTPNQDKNAKKQQTPASNKKQNKQNQSLVNGAATPKSDKKNNKGTPQPQQKQGGSPQKRTLAGGVHVEDIRVGDGPVAKPGKTVAVLYTGRLKSNNRVFDQATKGSGFKFRLGKGDVIKGWDVGVAGMTVGSKRRITCPPAMAYGKEGSLPTIPPDATLIFDVELKNVE